jgi:hypothetical protein
MKQHLSTFILLMLVLVSCNSTGESFDPEPVLYVGFSYVDDEGIDQMDPDTFDFFHIYYLQKNEETGEFELKEAREPQYAFYRDTNSLLYALRVFPNPQYIDGQSTTLIESPRDDTDTLRVQAEQKGKGIITEIIWYNGEKIWEQTSNTGSLYFTITKEKNTW